MWCGLLQKQYPPLPWVAPIKRNKPSLQRRGWPDYPGLLPVLGGLSKMYCPWLRLYPRKARKAAGNRCQHSIDFHARLQQRYPASTGCHKRSNGGSSCSSLHTSSVCRACRRLAESEGGTHADVVWMVRFDDAYWPTICSGLLFRLGRLCKTSMERAVSQHQRRGAFHGGRGHSIWCGRVPFGKNDKVGYGRRTRGIQTSFWSDPEADKGEGLRTSTTNLSAGCWVLEVRSVWPQVLWVSQWMEPKATMGFIWILFKPLGRAGPMAELELEAGLLWQRLGGWWLGKIYCIKFFGSTSRASAPTLNGNAGAWFSTHCWHFCPGSQWICGRRAANSNEVSDHLRGVLRDQRPAALQALACWRYHWIWIMVGVSLCSGMTLRLPEGLTDWMKITYGHSVQSMSIQLKNEISTWKLFPIDSKEFDTNIRSYAVDCVYIAVYISLLQ